MLINHGGSSSVLVNVVACCASSLGDVRRIFQEVIHNGGEILGVLDAFTSSIGDECHRFGKSLVIGADDDRNAVDRSLGHVVDAHTKATTHISHCGIAIDGREQSVAINDEYAVIADVF